MTGISERTEPVSRPDVAACLARAADDFGHIVTSRPLSVLIEDLSYEEYLRRLYRDERILRVTGEWTRPHPWLTLLLPEETAASFVPAVLADAAQHGLRTCGAVQLRPSAAPPCAPCCCAGHRANVSACSP